MKPTWNSASSSSAISAANVPARISPAEVITPPVRLEARDHRVAGGEAARVLLADPAHQEDVVVDAQRDEEDEREDRQVRVRVGLAEHVREDQRRRPERERERQDDGPDHVQRRDDAAQQRDQHEQDQHEHERHDQPRVGAQRLAVVVVLRP